MSQKDNAISVIQTLDRIKQLIENEQGDPGRLRYIYEFIQKGRPLYKSDRLYLEKKISAEVIFEKPEPPSEIDEIANSIQKLLHLRIGFPERLQFMLNRIRKEKPLFESDKKYLERKLEQIPAKFKKLKKSSIKFVLPQNIPTIQETPIIQNKAPEPIQDKISEPIQNKIKEDLRVANEKISKLQNELDEAQKTIASLKETIEIKNKEIESKDAEIQKLMDQYSKMMADTSLEEIELDKLKKKILDETESIDKQKLMSEQIKVQKEKLEQLIAYRKEYEDRVLREKEILEKQIKSETQKIAEKDKIVEDLTKKQEQLEQNRIERETILEQVKKEQLRLEEEIERQKEELDRAKEEYGDIIGQLNDSDDEKTDTK